MARLMMPTEIILPSLLRMFCSAIYASHFPSERCIYGGQKYSVFKVPLTTPLLSHISTINAKNCRSVQSRSCPWHSSGVLSAVLLKQTYILFGRSFCYQGTRAESVLCRNTPQFGAVEKEPNYSSALQRRLSASKQASYHSLEVQGHSRKEAVILCCP